MTTKQWLSRATNMDDELSELYEQLQKELSRLTSGTQNLSGDVIQSTQNPYKFDYFVELVEQYMSLMNKRYKEQTEILKAINRSDKRVYRLILMKHYIDGKTFDVIAEELHLSDRHVKRLHGWALVEMGGIINAME